MLGWSYLPLTQSNWMLGQYEVQAILRHRSVGCGRRRREYLVSFVGYDAAHNEWLPAANLANASELLQAYQAAHGLT